MSRIGQKPIIIPADVQVQIDGNWVSVIGPKGKLTQQIRSEIALIHSEGVLIVNRRQDSKLARSLHGLTRTLIANMVQGVTQGWQKALEVVGVGYRAQKQGENLVLSVGYSHPVIVTPPAGIQLQIVDGKIVVTGIDKALVGQIAATIRQVRPPDAYKGKGIRYSGEVVKTKPGKAAKTAVGVAGR